MENKISLFKSLQYIVIVHVIAIDWLNIIRAHEDHDVKDASRERINKLKVSTFNLHRPITLSSVYAFSISVYMQVMQYRQ